MKRQLMVAVALVAVIIGGGTGAVMAGHGPGEGCAGQPPEMEMGPGGFDGRMVRILKLTDSQQTLITALFDAHRKEVKPLFDKMHEIRRTLVQAAEATEFDEVFVRTAAVAQAKIETELTVSRLKIQARINGLLTPEQREMLKLLRPGLERMPMPPKGGE